MSYCCTRHGLTWDLYNEKSPYAKKCPLCVVRSLRKALEEIAYPIEAMRKNLKTGEQLNGQQAVFLSENAPYLKEIAKKALKSCPKEKEVQKPVDSKAWTWTQSKARGWSLGGDGDARYEK